MKSIQTKIISIIVTCVLSMTIAMTIISVVETNRYSSQNAEATVKGACMTQALKVDSYLEIVEKAVSDIIMLSEMERPSSTRFSDMESVEDYILNMRRIAIGIAENTAGANSVYFRVNPELNNSGKAGFFCVKAARSNTFRITEPTDITAYDPDDVEHVGWYYVPVRAGHSVWMDPYYNQNIDIMMVSYVVPIYDNDVLLGVIGMDIDFKLIMSTISDVDLYKGGFAEILFLSNRTLYRSDEKGVINSEIVQDKLYDAVVSRSMSVQLMDNRINGEDYKFAYTTLRSGSLLIAMAPKKEIFDFRNKLVSQELALMLIVFAIALFVTIHTTKKIIAPLKEITKAAKQYAEGNRDIELTCNTHDELELLTDSILAMAGKTNEYISGINAKAYTDGLTGLKNKARYIEFTEDIKNRFLCGEDLHLALVSFDLNNLKTVNDTLGHEAGDKLIKDAAHMICMYFKHSPVFRFGGDEFAAILMTEDYENRMDIIAEFREANIQNARCGGVVIASGMADFPDEHMDFDAAFQLADERMYENKAAIKMTMKKQ